MIYLSWQEGGVVEAEALLHSMEADSGKIFSANGGGFQKSFHSCFDSVWKNSLFDIGHGLTNQTPNQVFNSCINVLHLFISQSALFVAGIMCL